MSELSDLGLGSRAYYLWNDTLEMVVAEEDGGVRTPVASLTKMMTALVTVEQRNLEETVTVTPEMIQGLEEFAVIGLMVGQELTVEELLYATMLPSAGDAAQALAMSTAGSLEKFVEMMNARAAEIGMLNTHFNNSVGMDENNYSTPEDMVKLLREALKNESFREVFETFEVDLPSLGQKVYKTFSKTGAILGGKTGFTNAAGRCLASMAEIEGAKYILVTVGAEDGQHVTDAEKIYEWVAKVYEPLEIVKAGDWVVKLPVRESETAKMEFTVDQTVTMTLEDGVKREDLRYVYDGVNEITRDTELGEKLGEWKVYQGEQNLYTQELYYDQAVEFYNYNELVLGGVVSLVLLGGGIFVAWKGWKQESRRKKVWRGVAVSLGVGLLISLGWNWGLWQKWQKSDGVVEVNEMKTETESDAEVRNDEKTESENEENGENEENENNTQGEREPETGILIGGNCTTNLGNLMLINPNFTVDLDFIAQRQNELISVSQTYGITEYHPAGNGDNLMMPEAAAHLKEMLTAYSQAYPGHEMGTYSCFRARGTQCGRLCAATGTSDHHTGLTCDLIDLDYGSVLNTDDYANHLEWQWLKENSYKYGFIDRFPEAWAGGSMDEPLNVDANGTTGLFETWHYRYVGIEPATEIATGKYNNGNYDSLEHYLKMTGKVKDLESGVCRGD